jgi:hypothetical protein
VPRGQDSEGLSPPAVNWLRAILAWQDRIRDPSLTVLLVLDSFAIFVAAPLAAKGLPIARVIADSLALAALAVVVMLSRHWVAIIMILFGVVGVTASFLLSGASPSVPTTVLQYAGNILAFSALTWVTADIVYAPGRVTANRLQGAVVLYLAIATNFAMVYGLISALNPDAFVNVSAQTGGPKEIATLLYFSLTTLTTVGYGDVVAVDPLARSLANLESMLGQFYFAITMARLVALWLRDRGR